MTDRTSANDRTTNGTWGMAAVRSAAVLGAGIFGFMLVPNQLLSYLSLHVRPAARDLLVAGWWVIALMVCTWLFVRIQGRRPR